MFLGLPDSHPDPLDGGTDPKIRIRTEMSRIQKLCFDGILAKLSSVTNHGILDGKFCT
jgi:hypothetical protein